MAITVKNKTVLPNYIVGSGYFGAVLVSEADLLEPIPVQLDQFWGSVQEGKSSIENGKILNFGQCCQTKTIADKKYLVFGLRGDNGNRKYPVSAEEFVTFFNLFECTQATCLTYEQLQELEEETEINT